jgi:predicted Rossmann fold flavoprotein
VHKNQHHTEIRIAVVGAGASGLMASLQAAWNGAAVTLLERNDAVGRKLLVTGSGRCNITNDAAAAAAYTCADVQWMEALLSRFGVRDLLAVLAGIGIPVYKTPDGWYYPLSDSAHAVVNAFSSALDLAGVSLCTAAQVTSIEARGQVLAVRFLRDGKDEENEFERVIVSTGGKALPALGSRGELFPVLERLGHTVLPLRPALAPLLVDLGSLKPLQGVRLDVGVTLWKGSQRLAATAGNLIFTKWGLNGPAVMDLSHHVSARPQDELELSLNWLAFFQEEFDRLLAQQRTTLMPVRVFLSAFFAPKVAASLLKSAGLAEETPLRRVSDGALERLVAKLKDTRLPVKGVRDWEYCQISAGGVPVTEVYPQTMESRRVQGLFLTGETLDVVGPCGGYNLQYAFSSGALAGRAAAKGGVP